MVEIHHLIERNGRYQLLERSCGRGHDRAIYAVTTLAGDVIRQEFSLATARAWMDRCVEEDAAARSVCHSPRARAGPLRR